MKVSFAEQVEIIRKRKNVSLGELAQRLGVSVQNVSQRLKRDTFTIKDAEQYAAALGCSLNVEIVEPPEAES